MSSRPTLPHDDKHPKRRAKQLARQREIWRLDKTYHGLVFPDADTVLRQIESRWLHRVWTWFSWGPKLDALFGLGLREMIDVIWHKLRAGWNNLLARVLHAFTGPKERWWTRINRIFGRFNTRLTERIWRKSSPDRTPKPWSQRQPLSEEQLMQTLPELPKPPSYEHWKEDRYFGWERLAGQVPILIEHVTDANRAAVLAKLPLSAERFAASFPGDDLDTALSDGRMFVVDFSMLEGLEVGVSYGWRKWMAPAVALFVLTPDRTTFLPAAIQCGQDPDAVPYHTPADGERWLMAKIHYQVAESNYHGVVEHGVLCHMLVGALEVAAMRNLAPNHPIRVLLEPHMENTLGILIATKDIFGPGGLTAELQSVSIEGTIDLCNWAWDTFDWTERSSTREFSRRGVLDPAVLPDYPFRDDSILVTGAIRQFVTGYVDLYYSSDADVKQDDELAAWFEEIHTSEGVNGVGMPTIPTPETRTDLNDLLTDLLWRISPYHAVINYQVFNAMGFVPNTPTAAYAPPPRDDVDYGPNDWLWLMPPQEGISAQVDDTWNVANTRINHLGHYGDHFSDRRVAPLISSFQENLAAIEEQIEQRNAQRYLPFETLLPSNLTNSIHV